MFDPDSSCLRLALLNLDQERPLNHDKIQDVIRYVKEFFGCVLEVKEVPSTPVSSRGWESLEPRLNLPLKARPGRPDCERGGGGVQLLAPQLIECVEQLSRHGPETHGVPVAGAEVILGMTANEFLMDDAGLYPGEPAPEERTQRRFIRSKDFPVGVLTLSHLLRDERKGENKTERIFFRRLLKFISHSLLDLLGLRTCQVKECIAFLRPFDPNKTALFLCAKCEYALLKRTNRANEHQAAVRTAVTRYQNLSQFLTEKSSQLPRIRIGYRQYNEFEDECDWLRVAEDILREVATERHHIVDVRGGDARPRRRSLLNCLMQVHGRQPPNHVSQRTYSEPLLKRTCLVDMTMSAPFRHEQGDLGKWTSAVQNKKHTTGGLYVEVGGSLKGKTISNFVDSGLNASLIRREGSSETSIRKLLASASADITMRGATSKTIKDENTAGKKLKMEAASERPLMRRRNGNSLGYTAKSLTA